MAAPGGDRRGCRRRRRLLVAGGVAMGRTPVEGGAGRSAHRPGCGPGSVRGQAPNGRHELMLSAGRLRLFSGSASQALAKDVADMLRVPLGGLTVTRFTDGEVLSDRVRLGLLRSNGCWQVSIRVEENVRGKDVYIIQSTGPPINDNIVELLVGLRARLPPPN